MEVCSVCPPWFGIRSQTALVGSQCSDARGVVAVWELDSSNPPYDAKLTLWHTGLILSTEVMTTLVLNLIAKRLDWIV